MTSYALRHRERIAMEQMARFWSEEFVEAQTRQATPLEVAQKVLGASGTSAKLPPRAR